MRNAILLLGMLTALPAMSIDMILPAIPSMAEHWGQPFAVMNLILVLFFAVFATCLLFYGPVSDRVGRRPPLLFGLVVYVAASALCGMAWSAWPLIGFRVLQAAGAAASSSMAMAMTRDIYTGKERERVLAHIGIIMALAPMGAPLIGGVVLDYLNWRWIFYVQAALAGLAMAWVLRIPETNTKLSTEPMRRVWRGYGRLLSNRSYLNMTTLMSLSVLPLYCFLSVSSHIYINGFGLNEQRFSYFFSANAFCIMVGSFTFLRLTRVTESHRLITLGFLGTLLGGTSILLFGASGPVPFALSMGLVTFCMGVSRPPSNNLVLEQVETDIGAASSLLIFFYMMSGSLVMWLASLDWPVSSMEVEGLMAVAAGVIASIWWRLLRKRGVLRGVA